MPWYHKIKIYAIAQIVELLLKSMQYVNRTSVYDKNFLFVSEIRILSLIKAIFTLENKVGEIGK